MRAYYFLFILLLAIIPIASAEVKTIGIGNDVFIGESGIDITDCVGNAQQLAWFEAGSIPATDVPNYVLTIGDPANFYVAPSIFVGRTGNWYQWTGTGGATTVAFNVLDPSIDVKVWDQKPPDIIAPGDIIPVTVPSIVPVQPHIIAPGDIMPVTVPSIVPVQPHIIAPGDIMPVTVPDINSPSMPGMEWPSGYGKFESSDNARGIYYNGKLYVWSIWWSSSAMPWNENLYRIQYRTFQNGQLSGPSQLWDGTTYAEPAPVVVKYANGTEKMFVFITGKNGNIYFTRLNGTVWEDGDWLKIADSATGQYITTGENGWEVAPVYEPRYHRLYLYYAKDYKDYLYVAVSDDFGNTWNNYKVENSPKVYSAPGAVLYYDDIRHNDVLLAVKDTDKTIRIFHMDMDIVRSSEVLPIPSSDNIYGYGRPFLIDVGPNIALMYAAEHGDQTYCPDWYIPHICVFNKTTGQWGEPYQATTLPDLGVAQGEYEFHWQPNGALDPTSNTFWLFYGFELCALYTDNTNNGPWWMFTPIKTPGT